MARTSYGTQAQKHAKSVLEALLIYANDELEIDLDEITTKRFSQQLQISWQTEYQCIIRTKIKVLQDLTALLPKPQKLSKEQIRESLKRYKDFLEILQDHRTATQGSEYWHFTLELWHPRKEIAANLARFDTEWEQRRSRNGTTQPIDELSLIEAPDVSGFHGRTTELAQLTEWAIQDRCRTIAIVGMGGIGKTALATKFACSSGKEFDRVIWRSLLQAPPLEDLLAELLETLTPGQAIPQRIDSRITRLLEQLRLARCLLVLDNLEAVLQTGEPLGAYRSGYERYAILLRQFGEVPHQSTIVLTSREKPEEISALEGFTLPVRSIRLQGLLTDEAKVILQAKGLQATHTLEQQLIEVYHGNPLALKVAATAIQELFDGSIATFLAQGTTLFKGIRNLLDQQFDRLSPFEHHILYWLAINREPTPMQEIHDDLVPAVSKAELLQTLESVQRRSLIEQNDSNYTLQPVVMEYVTERLIEQVIQELIAQQPVLFKSHALVKVQAKEYVRETQIRLIIRPIINPLISEFRSISHLEAHLQNLVSIQQTQAPLEPGYVGGNLLNLLRELNTDFSDRDFSNLAIWQADLRNLTLHRTNFSNAHFVRSSFTQKVGSIFAIAFSPDGNYMVTGDASAQVYSWCIADSQLFLPFQGHLHWVFALAFSPDGRTLISGSGDQTLKVWNATTGELIRTLQNPEAIFCVVYSPDGQTVAIASGDHTVKLWNPQTGQWLRTFQGHTDRVCCVAYRSDGRLLASGGADQTVKVWDADSGMAIATLQGHTKQVRSVAFYLDHTLTSSSEDGTIKRWDIQTGNCIQTLTGHTYWVNAIAYSADGKVLSSASEDQTVKLWDAKSGKLLRTLYGHENPVRAIAFHPQRRIFASAGSGKAVKLWDAETGQTLKTFQGFTNSVHRAVFSSEGQRVFSAHGDGLIRIWSSQTQQLLQTLTGHTNFVHWLACAPRDSENRDLLVSCSNDHTIRLWNINSGQLLRTLRGHQGLVWRAIFSPDGHTIASCGGDQTIKLWNASSGWLSQKNSEEELCFRTIEGHTDWVSTISFSPDQQMLASGSFDQTIKLWNLTTGELIKTLQGHTSPVLVASFHPDQPILVSGSDDATLRLWNVETGESYKILQGHQGGIWSIAFSPNGEMLATGSADQTIRLWDVQTGQTLRIFQGHSNQPRSVAFHPNGQTILSSGDDETIRFWSVETGQCLQILRTDRPYEGMNLSGVTGLTMAQKQMLNALGATPNSSST
ncbi:NB-ARC domain-containing protein [Leptolyngbya sp. AN03gr2]|uniref:WD40 domain-containing protein n=1 Tax=unclassified Leptolyngbya TaxID=2650499 RepID=UPI003D30FA0F